MDKGYLYKITHTPTGMLYFGSRKTPEGVSVSADTYMGSPVGSNRMRELFDTRPDTEFEKEILTVGLYADIVEMEPLLIEEAWDKFGQEHEGGKVCNIVASGHYIITDAVKAKMSASKLNMSDATRAKMSKAKLNMSDATRAKMSAAQKIRFSDKSARDQLSDYAARGRAAHMKQVINTDTSEVFESIKAAADHAGVLSQTMWKRVKCGQKGGIWRYLDEYQAA